MTDKSVADELLEVLQAHRQKRQQPPPPAPTWTAPEDQVQWSPDEGDSEESSDIA